MKYTKTAAFGLLCILILFSVTGCTSDGTASSEQTPTASAITVMDMKEREIRLDGPAERIVALTAADCEILYAIGAGALLVGRGEYCDYPAEVLQVPAVSSGAETNIEQIIALQPDVLLMNTMAQSKEQTAQLEAAGIRVVVSEATDVEGVYTAIELIGAVTGKEENAAALIRDMQEALTQLQQEAEPVSSGTVYFEISPLPWGLWTAGSGTFMDEIASLLGLENCFADVTGWAEISEEQVLARNPDFIVTTASSYETDGISPTEEILSRSGWEQVTAVQNRSVLHLPDDELTRPGPRLVKGARMLLDFTAHTGSDT